MSSLNKTSRNSMKTTNRSGHEAYRLDDKTKLVTMALTTMLGEPKYYGDNTSDMIKLAEDLCKGGHGEFVAKLAVWARTKGNLRSVSHALMSVAARNCKSDSLTPSFVRKAARAIASMRGDDGTEMLAAYKAMYGKPFPHALQRGVRDAIEGASPYTLGKYQSRNRDMKLRDALRITHPRPIGVEVSEAMGKVIDGTMPMPKSWETELSDRGNTKEVWDELICEDRIGIFACVRNLRNMIRAGADVGPVLDKLRDRDVIKRSRLMPFRFFSAYKELSNAGLASTRVTNALDDAMGNACANVDRLTGRTVVMIDTSGSMTWGVSERSVTTCRDIAAVLGAMVVRVSDDVLVIGFDSRASMIPMTGRSVLGDVSMVPSAGGWTDMHAAFAALDTSGFDADRVVILSDNEVNHGTYAIQRSLDSYRRKVGHDVWCHAIDLQGYGTRQVIGGKTQVIAGWSESILKFIGMAEEGFGGLVDEIEAMSL